MKTLWVIRFSHPVHLQANPWNLPATGEHRVVDLPKNATRALKASLGAFDKAGCRVDEIIKAGE